MISEAGTFDGLYDGMRKTGKYFDYENQLFRVSIDNRVGKPDKMAVRGTAIRFTRPRKRPQRWELT